MSSRYRSRQENQKASSLLPYVTPSNKNVKVGLNCGIGIWQSNWFFNAHGIKLLLWHPTYFPKDSKLTRHKSSMKLGAIMALNRADSMDTNLYTNRWISIVYLSTKRLDCKLLLGVFFLHQMPRDATFSNFRFALAVLPRTNLMRFFSLFYYRQHSCRLLELTYIFTRLLIEQTKLYFWSQKFILWKGWCWISGDEWWCCWTNGRYSRTLLKHTGFNFVNISLSVQMFKVIIHYLICKHLWKMKFNMTYSFWIDLWA